MLVNADPLIHRNRNRREPTNANIAEMLTVLTLPLPSSHHSANLPPQARGPRHDGKYPEHHLFTIISLSLHSTIMLELTGRGLKVARRIIAFRNIDVVVHPAL